MKLYMVVPTNFCNFETKECYGPCICLMYKEEHKIPLYMRQGSCCWYFEQCMKATTTSDTNPTTEIFNAKKLKGTTLHFPT